MTIKIVLLALLFAAFHYRKQVRGWWLRRTGCYYASVRCVEIRNRHDWARHMRNPFRFSTEDPDGTKAAAWEAEQAAKRPKQIIAMYTEQSTVSLSDDLTHREWFGSLITTDETELEDARNAIELELSRRNYVEIGTTKTWRYND